MMNRRFSCFVFGLVFAASAATPRPAAAFVTIQTVFDTVDSVELKNDSLCPSCLVHVSVQVKGVVAGQSEPSSHFFDFGPNADVAAHCERLALIAMSKSGKYQFGIGATIDNTVGHGDCKLIRINP